MSSYIGDDLRKLIAIRAAFLCEYCLIHEIDTNYGCQVDHIISLKHDGKTTPENLAYACVFCNRHKGTELCGLPSNLSAFLIPEQIGGLIILKWMGYYSPFDRYRESNCANFGFNHSVRILERQILMAIGKYPSSMTTERMR